MTPFPGINRNFHSRAVSWSARSLVAVSWLSGVMFAAYIIGFFFGSAVRGQPASVVRGFLPCPMIDVGNDAVPSCQGNLGNGLEFSTIRSITDADRQCLS